MAGNFVSDNCRVVPTRLTATTLTTVLTVTGYTQIVGVRIVNFHASSTPIIHLQYKPAGSATSFYYSGQLHAAGRRRRCGSPSTPSGPRKVICIQVQSSHCQHRRCASC